VSPLSPAELVRYSRHLTLPEVGPGGQQRLKAARVLIVGAGGLGSPAALYLAAAGVGTIGLVDFDAVDPSNLQRQVLHGTGAIGRSKLESARERLGDLNPEVRVEAFPERLSSSNARRLVGSFDLTLDGSDNFPTRYLVSDASVLERKVYVYGSVFRFEGQVSVFGAAGGPCYRCLFAEPPPPDLIPNCADAGVLGVLPGVIGTLQAVEAIKLILGIGDPLVGRLLLYDALRASVREVRLHRDPACAVCGDQPSVRQLVDYEVFCGVSPVGAPAATEIEIAPRSLDALRSGPAGAVVLVDVREPWEFDLARIEGSRLIPFGELSDRLGELDSRATIVTVCHRGARSIVAQQVLAGAGYRAKSLAGGIDRWSVEVDPGVPRY